MEGRDMAPRIPNLGNKGSDVTFSINYVAFGSWMDAPRGFDAVAKKKLPLREIERRVFQLEGQSYSLRDVKRRYT
jgi:hypothetical protein